MLRHVGRFILTNVLEEPAAYTAYIFGVQECKAIKGGGGFAIKKEGWSRAKSERMRTKLKKKSCSVYCYTLKAKPTGSTETFENTTPHDGIPDG
jgi:hypothetical protein